MTYRLRWDQKKTWLILALALAVVFVLLVHLGVAAQLLAPDAGKNGENEKNLKDFVDAVNKVKDPATIALGSVGFVGVLAGGGLLALGQQTGVRIMGMSAGAIGGVFLGNGLIQ
jgi:hypothetical protein